MTLTSLFGGGHLARDPSSAVGNVEYYNLDRADMMQGHEWKSTKSEMKKTKSTLAALTLLAFLFFLNLLLSCLKDTVQSGNPEIIVMPQQRVTRGMLSGQLTGAVGAVGGAQGDAGDDPDRDQARGMSTINSFHGRKLLEHRDDDNGVDYETSLETPEVLSLQPRRGLLEEPGVEPGETERRGNAGDLEEEDDSSSAGDWEDNTAPWEAAKALLLRALGRQEEPPPSTPWAAIKRVLRGLGRRIVGKGWEESLQSLQVPGSQFFKVGDKLATYAMPIVRDASTMLGLARCKELVVCETSRLSEMFADEEVTSIFHGVFKWMYGMKEPELRSIAKDGEIKNNCKHFVRRCKTETEDRSWLPMIANLLDFFIT